MHRKAEDGRRNPVCLLLNFTVQSTRFFFRVGHFERVTGFMDGVHPTRRQAVSTTATALQPASEWQRGTGASAWARGRSQPGRSPRSRARAPLGQRRTARAKRGLGADGNVQMCVVTYWPLATHDWCDQHGEEPRVASSHHSRTCGSGQPLRFLPDVTCLST